MVDKTTAAHSKPSPFSERLALLWKDKRPYRARLLLSFFVTLALSFTFLFFGPVEITASSSDSLDFTVSQITPIMGILAAAVLVVVSPLVSLLRGRIFNYAVTAIFSFTLCGYVQGNILNGPMGALTGDAIAWYDEKFRMLFNMACWVLLFLLPYVVLYFSKKVWKNALSFVSLALVVMQLVALVTLVMGGAYGVSKQKGNFLTNDEMFAYSKTDNTLVFLLDRLDYQYIEGVLEKNPAFFDQLDGFTSYQNATSEFLRTNPAANYMLTGCDELLYREPAADYFENSWNENNILKDLSENDYTVDIYAHIAGMLGRGNSTGPYVSNLSSNRPEGEQKISLNTKNVVKGLAFLSAYRYLPTTMKPFFWCSTDDVNRDVFVNDNSYRIDETAYDRGLSSLSLGEDRFFKFYHFNGPHAPFRLTEEGVMSDSGETDATAQTMGSFNILYRAFDKMKELGIYDSASIIITADHGRSVSDYKPLDDAVTIGLFYKPSGSAGAPLKTSMAPVSLKNIPATVAKASGLDYQKYGKPLDEVGENEKITRLFYKTIMGKYREEELRTYEINGDARDFANWTEASSQKIEHPFY